MSVVVLSKVGLKFVKSTLNNSSDSLLERSDASWKVQKGLLGLDQLHSLPLEVRVGRMN